jgi:hydroxymethylpyrimidine pyrophosphatase-like HAD family hydrolase
MCADRKLSLPARNADEEAALAFMSGLDLVTREALLEAEFVIRVTLFSRDHGNSAAFAGHFERDLRQPVYITHFPLSVLSSHRSNPLQVLDVHAPCLGKGEALRILEEQHGIRPERVVAVGDATNDIPMFERAGLSVAMENGMEEARAAAKRVIGSNNSDALAKLVEELFL